MTPSRQSSSFGGQLGPGTISISISSTELSLSVRKYGSRWRRCQWKLVDWMWPPSVSDTWERFVSSSPSSPSFPVQARAAAALRRAAARGDTEKERCALLALYLGMLVSGLITTACWESHLKVLPLQDEAESLYIHCRRWDMVVKMFVARLKWTEVRMSHVGYWRKMVSGIEIGQPAHSNWREETVSSICKVRYL